VSLCHRPAETGAGDERRDRILTSRETKEHAGRPFNLLVSVRTAWCHLMSTVLLAVLRLSLRVKSCD